MPTPWGLGGARLLMRREGVLGTRHEESPGPHAQVRALGFRPRRNQPVVVEPPPVEEPPPDEEPVAPGQPAPVLVAPGQPEPVLVAPGQPELVVFPGQPELVVLPGQPELVVLPGQPALEVDPAVAESVPAPVSSPSSSSQAGMRARPADRATASRMLVKFFFI